MIPPLALLALATAIELNQNEATVHLDRVWRLRLEPGHVRAVSHPDRVPTDAELEAAVPTAVTTCPELTAAIAARTWRRVSRAYRRREEARAGNWADSVGIA